MTERCRLCGRFAVRLDRGYCSARCAELSASYTSPTHAPAALAAPDRTCVATLLVSGAPPAGSVPIGGGLYRLGADSWDALDAAIEESGADAEVFTLQQFAGRGLAPAIAIRRGAT
jgi:hypothetical protein